MFVDLRARTAKRQATAWIAISPKLWSLGNLGYTLTLNHNNDSMHTEINLIVILRGLQSLINRQ